MSAFPTTNLAPMFLGGGNGNGNGNGGHTGHTGGVFVPGRVKAAFGGGSSSSSSSSSSGDQQRMTAAAAAPIDIPPPDNTMENFPSLSMAAATAIKKK